MQINFILGTFPFCQDAIEKTLRGKCNVFYQRGIWYPLNLIFGQEHSHNHDKLFVRLFEDNEEELLDTFKLVIEEQFTQGEHLIMLAPQFLSFYSLAALLSQKTNPDLAESWWLHKKAVLDNLKSKLEGYTVRCHFIFPDIETLLWLKYGSIIKKREFQTSEQFFADVEDFLSCVSLSAFHALLQEICDNIEFSVHVFNYSIVQHSIIPLNFIHSNYEDLRVDLTYADYCLEDCDISKVLQNYFNSNQNEINLSSNQDYLDEFTINPSIGDTDLMKLTRKLADHEVKKLNYICDSNESYCKKYDNIMYYTVGKSGAKFKRPEDFTLPNIF